MRTASRRARSAGRKAIVPSFRVAVNSRSEFLLVWERDADLLTEVVGRWWTAGGSPLGEVFPINGPGAPSRRALTGVDCAADDRCVVVWSAQTAAGSSLKARFLSASGVPTGAEKVLGIGPDGAVGGQVASAADGRFAVSWLRPRLYSLSETPLTLYDPFLRTFDAQGEPLGEVAPLALPCPHPDPYGCVWEASRSLAEWNDEGELIAVWDSFAFGYESPDATIWARRLAADGSALGPAAAVNPRWSGGIPALAWSPELRSFAVLWLSVAGDEGFLRRVALRQLDAGGQPIGAELPAMASRDFVAFSGALAFTGTSLWATWNDGAPVLPVGRALRLSRFETGEPTCEGPFVDGDVPCVPLLGNRFKAWALFRRPGGAPAGAPAFVATDRAGFVYFNSVFNPELVLKMLDGRPVNRHFWFFWGAMSDQEYSIAIYDRQSGATRSYYNTAGNLASAADIEAFGDGEPRDGLEAGEALSFVELEGSEPVETTTVLAPRGLPAPCQVAQDRLCLQSGRFEVKVDWKDFAGGSGPARAVQLTDQGGYFTFFNVQNVELALKLLDGTAANSRFWLFYASLSNVEFTVRITDHAAGTTREYRNPPSTMRSMVDLQAF